MIQYYIQHGFLRKKLLQSGVQNTCGHSWFAEHLHCNHQSGFNLGIAPFILMTFVENAFKHVSKDSDKPNWITIQVNLEHQQLDFAISNSKSNIVTQDVVNYGGIGLQNVKRRLELLYAGQYELDVKNTSSSFEIKLRLQLSELLAPSVVEDYPQVRQNKKFITEKNNIKYEIFDK